MTQDIADIKSRCIDAMLELAANRPWDGVSLYDIATQADCDPEVVTSLFTDKDAVIIAYAARIDADTAEAMGGQSLADDTPRDRLFDILMERFDLLNDNKAAVVSIVAHMSLDPKQIFETLPGLARSMKKMLQLADIETDGWQGCLRIAGLTALYLKVMRVWIKDDSVDMAATMAVLDKALDKAEQAMGYLKV